MKYKEFFVYPLTGNNHCVRVHLFNTAVAMRRAYIEDSPSINETKEDRELKVKKSNFAAVTLNVGRDYINEEQFVVSTILFCKKYFTAKVVAHEFVHAMTYSWRYFSKFPPEAIFADNQTYNANNYYDADEEFATLLGNCVDASFYYFDKTSWKKS